MLLCFPSHKAEVGRCCWYQRLFTFLSAYVPVGRWTLPVKRTEISLLGSSDSWEVYLTIGAFWMKEIGGFKCMFGSAGQGRVCQISFIFLLLFKNFICPFLFFVKTCLLNCTSGQFCRSCIAECQQDIWQNLSWDPRGHDRENVSWMTSQGKGFKTDWISVHTRQCQRREASPAACLGTLNIVLHPSTFFLMLGIRSWTSH